MKRVGNLYNQMCTLENLQCAEVLSQQGKAKQYGVKVYNQNKEANLLALKSSFESHTFTTSKYTTFTISEPKEREIFRLPYYPDRIAQHAAMIILKPIFLKHFTADSYGNIDGRGVHLAAAKLKAALRDKGSTVYCLKIDIKKFYPSVDHTILKQLLQRKTKDGQCLHLQIEWNGQKRVMFSGSSFLIDQIKQVPESHFPFQTKITKENKHFQFN